MTTNTKNERKTHYPRRRPQARTTGRGHFDKNIPASLKRYDFGNYKGEKLKVIPLGGMEEIGRNMTVFEYEDEIVIIDLGFQFPEENMLGIDYIIPDISYLKGKEDKIKAVIITHGHYDHIGAIPHLMPKLGNPPMYMGALTAGIVKERQKEYRNAPELKITHIDKHSKIKAGKYFNFEFFKVNHTIPDNYGIALYTPAGLIVHSSDFKIDYTPIAPDEPADLARFANLGNQGVLALMIDSTDTDQPGQQISEGDVLREMDKIFANATGRVIIGTFASQLARLQIMVDLSHKHGRKLAVEGRSMKSNLDIAHKLGYLKVPRGLLIDSKDSHRYPNGKVTIIGTGAQGQDRSFLMRYANDEHRSVSIQKGDMVIFSSSVIPGNERTVQTLKDTLCRKGVNVVHTDLVDIHAGGHGKAEDAKLLIRLTRPKYLIPNHGTRYKREANGNLGKEIGIPEKNVLLSENGQITEFTRTTAKVTNKKVPTEYVFVDGIGVDDVNHVVLRDRQMMAEDGMFVVIATVKKSTGKVLGSPDIISRGFVYMKENKKLIEQTRSKVKKILDSNDPESGADDTYLKSKLRHEIGQFLFSKTQRRPMILPVIIEI